MQNKFSEELYLTNKTAGFLYHTYAEKLPIIDYHCHLNPAMIWENKTFEDLGQIWLMGDHYKWRAMRSFGIDETYITGSANYHEKFLAFAKILPKLIGNPLYIWCALELKRYFDIEDPLGPENAEEIYRKTRELIQQRGISPRWCMDFSQVQLVCTTEDPTDTLEYHKKLAKDPTMKTKVLSAFRPDKAMFCEKPGFVEYLVQLGACTGKDVSSFKELLGALEARLGYFKGIGTTVSDDGIPYFCWADYTPGEIEEIFTVDRAGRSLSPGDINKYRSAFLYEMGRIYFRHNFIMQLHIGTLLDANTAQTRLLGNSMGFDCIDDTTQVKSAATLLDRLNLAEELPKTILYPLDIRKIESFGVLAAGFCEEGVKAKVQLGTPWWFSDQAYGIDLQFQSVGNLYPVSLSVGMLTDSRSFFSYPRHELYRRVLCNYLGGLVEKGEYFSPEVELKEIIEDICYNNVGEFFNFPV